MMLGAPAWPPAGGQTVVSSVSRVEPRVDGSIRIVLRDSVDRDFSGSVADPAVQSLLVGAVRDSVDAGVRIDALGLLRDRIDHTEVRSTFLAALRLDPDDGVRIKTLELLRPAAARPAVSSAVLEALRADRSALVRAQAADLLTVGSRGSAELAGVFQELMQRQKNLDVRRQG